MERDDLKELHYITPFANVASICRMGILSHNKAVKINHTSIAMPEIQERRKKRRVPGARPLHDYANLYICARNPMLYKITRLNIKVCVLSLHTYVLDIPGTIIVDRNAASMYARFAVSPGGLIHVDKEMVFAKSWKHKDLFEEWRRKSIKCAEVLVPDSVEPKYLQFAYVSNSMAKDELELILIQHDLKLRIKVDHDLFFS